MSNQENVFETILAPMTGTAVAITEVPDPIFIEKILEMELQSFRQKVRL